MTNNINKKKTKIAYNLACEELSKLTGESLDVLQNRLSKQATEQMGQTMCCVKCECCDRTQYFRRSKKDNQQIVETFGLAKYVFCTSSNCSETTKRPDKSKYVVWTAYSWEFWLTEEDAKMLQEKYGFSWSWSKVLIPGEAYEKAIAKAQALKEKALRIMERQDKVKHIVNSLSDYQDEITNRINARYESEKDMLLTYCAVILQKHIQTGDHYEWRDVYDPFDKSGDIYETGLSIKDEIVQDPKNYTLDDLLEEYTGGKVPTFVSGIGWGFTKIGEELSDELMYEISYSMVCDIVTDVIEEKLLPLADDDEMRHAIIEACDNLDYPEYGYDSKVEFLSFENLLNDFGIRAADMPAIDFVQRANPYLEKCDDYNSFKQSFMNLS